jgi:hypothetical protein
MTAITDFNIRSGVFRDMLSRYAAENFGADYLLYENFVKKINLIYSALMTVESIKAEKTKNGKH